jgi:hypothetical protein
MTVAKIRKVSRIMSALCVVGMIGLPVSLAVGWGYPELIGGLLLVIAWVMGEGVKMADENRQFV